ncbi:protein of unknown function [Acidithiobacillus ferrivorans]|uniref:Uncharacterized protein n=1 Tax=Acidithiobacillus ferrivorans TaxID=160808 RepID=A0A060UXV4_9PROT|nr:hypothetical protein AFERRI_530239 [Acidithiobacillus ferrivorans]SMH67704.1 protein of unknown function [Acidithiobacillus ferrivorans]
MRDTEQRGRSGWVDRPLAFVRGGGAYQVLPSIPRSRAKAAAGSISSSGS